MNAGLREALSWLDWSLVLTYLRVQTCILVMPALGERALAGRVKVAVAMSLTPLLVEFVRLDMPDFSQSEAAKARLPLVMAEMAIGFALGMMVRVMVFAINIAATAIASTASLSQIMGASNEASPHPIGNMYHLAGIALVMVLGLPLLLVNMLADSLVFWPLGQTPSIDNLLGSFVGLVATSFKLAMLLSAPFILGGFLFQALSGVISRVMPALPVVFIGAPAAIGLALMALVVVSPMILSLWADALLSFELPIFP